MDQNYVLQQIIHDMNTFTSLTGIDMKIIPVNTNGKMTSSPDFCKFCDKISFCSEKKKQCQAMTESAVLCSQNIQSGCIYFCPAGLCHITSFVRTGDKAPYAMVSAPIVCTIQDEYPVSDVIKRLSLPKKEADFLHKETFRFPHVTPDKLFSAAKLLFIVSNCRFGALPSNESLEFICSDLRRAAKTKSIEQVSHLFSQILENIINESGTNFMQTKLFFIYAVFMILKIMSELSSSKTPKKNSQNFSFLLAEADSIGKLQHFMANLKDAFIHTVFEPVTLKQNATIEQAVDLIHKNFSKKISQSDVAKSVYLSPSYFSQLFREVKGVRFSDYVNQVRISHAKDLLTRPSVKQDKVYTMVGYDSRSYFIKMFRKNTGTTPTNYRRLHMK